MYERLSKVKSPNGVTIDKCIQPSVDNKADIIGLVAGDPECYEVFVGYNIVYSGLCECNEHIHCRHVVTYLFHDRLTDRR